jgi:nicotinamidase-related amidase
VFPLPLEQTALVLVDFWDYHHIDSWLERAAKCVKRGCLPVLRAARKVGMTVIHAPSPEVAERHYAEKLKRYSPPPKYRLESAPPPDWPPPEFRRRQGDDAIFRDPRSQPPGIATHWHPATPLNITSLVDVRDDEFVIANAHQMHELLAERRVLHLVYIGFATNWCIINRDYGVRDMTCRGYNVILVRDATEGVEFPDTLRKRWATELAIREVEGRYGFTTSKKDFREACKGIDAR